MNIIISEILNRTTFIGDLELTLFDRSWTCTLSSRHPLRTLRAEAMSITEGSIAFSTESHLAIALKYYRGRRDVLIVRKAPSTSSQQPKQLRILRKHVFVQLLLDFISTIKSANIFIVRYAKHSQSLHHYRCTSLSLLLIPFTPS